MGGTFLVESWVFVYRAPKPNFGISEIELAVLRKISPNRCPPFKRLLHANPVVGPSDKSLAAPMRAERLCASAPPLLRDVRAGLLLHLLAYDCRCVIALFAKATA